MAIGLPTISLRPMTTALAPAIGNAAALEHLDHAGRRAGSKQRAALHEAADIDRMEAVDVLGRVEGIEHPLRRAASHRAPAAAIGPGFRRARRWH